MSERGLVHSLRWVAAGGLALSLGAAAVLLAVLFDDHPETMQSVFAALGQPQP